MDMLHLGASTRLDELPLFCAQDSDLGHALNTIIAARLNSTRRILR